MNEESLYSIPFDEKFVKAITSPDEKEWYKYRLGVDSPTLGEILDMPGARTGRFDRASQERVTLFKLYQEHLAKQNEKRGDAIDFRPGSQEPQPGREAIQGAPGNMQQLTGAIRAPLDMQALDESPLMARKPLPPTLTSNFRPGAPTIADLKMPISGAPAQPATPMFIPGAGEIRDPRMQEFGKSLLKGPVSPKFANPCIRGSVI